MMRRPARGHGLGFCIGSSLDSSRLTLGTLSLALQSPISLRLLPTHHANSGLDAPLARGIGTPIHRVQIRH